MAITYGSLVTCSVTPVGDVDLFQFQGTTGETVQGVVVATGTTASTSPEFCVALYGPSGATVVNYQCAHPTTSFSATLASTGTYKIQVVTAYFTGTGPYTVSLERLSAPPSPTARPIAFQSIVDDQINLVGESDLYTFNALAGTVVQGTVVATGTTASTSPEFCEALYGPSGATVINYQCAYPTTSFSATLASPGTYTIQVVTAYFTGTGPYTVNLVCLADCPAQAPAAVTVGLTSGSGTSPTFTFAFSDSGGYQNLSVVDILINSALDGRQACYVAFQPTGASSGTVLLVDDAGDAGGPFQSLSVPGGGSISNSQCSISGAGSSVAGSGTSLTLTLAITFSGTFAGNKVVYAAAREVANNSGWQALATWGVPGSPIVGPGVGGMSPTHNSNLSNTYMFTFTDTNGWQDIAVTDVLVNSALDGRQACYVAFVPTGASSGTVLLVDDAGDAGGPFQSLSLPGSGTISNSQCSISGTGGSVNASGNSLTLTLAITFNSNFAGNRVFYLATRSSALNSGWQAAGTASVP